MEEDLHNYYDVVVFGTGLVECLVAGAASRAGKTVLHLDKNCYYGGQWASFSLDGIEEWAASISQPLGDVFNTDEVESLDDENVLTVLVQENDIYSNVHSVWHAKDDACCERDAAGGISPKQPSQSVCAEVKEVDESLNISEVPSAEGISVPNEMKEVSDNSEQWTKTKLLSLSRRFNIDLAPNILYSRGDMVELLISSNVSRYIEFKCLTRLLCWREVGEEGGALHTVPCSRAQVFTSKTVSLLEKRILMKFLQLAATYTEQTKRWEDIKSEPLSVLLEREHITGQLTDFVLRGMALTNPSVTVESGLQALQLFLTSLGRYGPSPFLATLYGSGELPQAFCRLCAVFGGTYVLGRGVEAVISSNELLKPIAGQITDSRISSANISECVEETNVLNAAKKSEPLCSKHIIGIVSQGKRINCGHLVLQGSASISSIERSPHNSGNLISRAIFILNCNLLQETPGTVPKQIEGYQDGGVSLAQLTGADEQVVVAAQLASDTQCCAANTWLLHLSCYGCNAEADLAPAIEQLLMHHKHLRTANVTSDDSPFLYSLYFNQKLPDVQQTSHSNLYMCGGPRCCLDYAQPIREARSIFSKMFPDEEFMPRAPDPDEIIFENS